VKYALMTMMALALMACGSSKVMKTIDSVQWQVTQIGAKDLTQIPDDERPTMNFDADNMRVSGSSGCNTYSGGYTLAEDLITFGPMAVTKKACPDMSIEDAFTNAAQKATRMEIKGALLRFYDAANMEVMEAIAVETE